MLCSVWQWQWLAFRVRRVSYNGLEAGEGHGEKGRVLICPGCLHLLP